MKYLELALDTAKSLGADYADIRIQKSQTEHIYLRNMSLKDTSLNQLHGYGIRIFKKGAWGFAHSNIFSEDAVVKTVKRAYAIAEQSARIKHGSGLQLATERSYIDSYKTPYCIDPFKVPLSQKVELMMEVNRTMLNYADIKMALFTLESRKDEKLFGSTLGTRLNLETVYIEPMFMATAVTAEDSQSRTYSAGGQAVGWEYIQNLNLIEKAEKIAEEAIMKVKADSLGPEKRRTLILDPFHMALTMHESVGHPTELDRVLGWEADYAGISFATPEKLGKFHYGSKIVNFVADNLLERGLATAG